MGRFWIILQRFKSGNQMLPSIWILDGEKQTLGDFHSTF